MLVDEEGQRQADLMPIAAELAVDANPTWSPDGRTIAFASSRGRATLAETSLWLVGLATREARRIGQGAAVERDPRWTPDGHALIYASSARGTFDLYRLPIAAGPDGVTVAGPAVPLTSAPGDELSPSVSPDGSAVVYMSIDRATGRSHLERIPLAGGAPVRLTDGPADMTPSYAPDGASIAFAAPSASQRDLDLYAIAPDGGARRLLHGSPSADENGPLFSRDGRFLFATAVYRSLDGRPILSSIVVIDLKERPPTLRALHDRAAVAPRFGVAVAPLVLDARKLHGNRPYLDAVRRAVTDHLERGAPDGEAR